MVKLKYVITDELGIHARPAAQLVKQCSAYESSISVGTLAKMVDAKRVMGVMGLALKQGDELTMTFDGPDADAALLDLKEFLEKNL